MTDPVRPPSALTRYFATKISASDCHDGIAYSHAAVYLAEEVEAYVSRLDAAVNQGNELLDAALIANRTLAAELARLARELADAIEKVQRFDTLPDEVERLTAERDAARAAAGRIEP